MTGPKLYQQQAKIHSMVHEFDQQTLLFSLAYQTPAWLLGVTLKHILPYPAVRAVFVLPGTFIHELLHLMVGLLLNGKPVSMSLWPRRSSQGQWILGAVGFVHLRWYNAVFIALAPLLAIVVAMLLTPVPSGWSPRMEDLEHWAIAAPILAMCLPSSTDLRMAMKSWPIICAMVALIAWHTLNV